MDQTEYTWRAATSADLPALAALDAASTAVDGPASVPTIAYRELLDMPGASVLCATTGPPDAPLVAAGWARQNGERADLGGTVHPAQRRRGLGTHILRWSEEQARALGPPALFSIRNENVTPSADALYTREGYTQTFAEHWMQRDLAAPLPTLPPSLPTLTWTEETAPGFFAAYTAAFSTRPAFRPPPAEEWIAEYVEDPDFRPDLSLLALDGDTPVAFLAAGTLHIADLGQTVGWVSQVGSHPAWRGRGVAAALIVATLAAFRREGLPAVGLHVNVNNPGAIAVYDKLGFRPAGLRARYTKPGGPT
jgi:mycothiol synthase